MRRLGALAGLVLLAGCRTVSGPEQVVDAYARAIQENRLDDAYALTSGETRASVSRDAFLARYQEPSSRQARARALLGGATSLRALGPGVEAVREGEAWLIREPAPEEGARRALGQFLDAVEQGDFAAAYRLLSPELRARYTPERLARDFAAEPLARERLARARAALPGPLLVVDGEVRFLLGAGKAVRLVSVGEVFRVAAIE